jgi:hypothetical protein
MAHAKQGHSAAVSAADGTAAALAIGAVAALGAGVGALVRVHFLPTGYKPWRDAVSDYGVGPHHAYYRAMVVALGGGAALLTAALSREPGVGSEGLVWLAVYAAARVAIAAFPTDLPGRPVTPVGRAHLALAAAAFTAIAIAAPTISSDLSGKPGWVHVCGFVGVVGHAVSAAAIATFVAAVVPRLRATVFGAVERLLYLTSLIWLLTVAVHLAELRS